MTAIPTDEQLGIVAIAPGHHAGMAHLRTYFRTLRVLATGAGIAAVVAAIVWVCVVTAAAAIGHGMVEEVMRRTAGGIDWAKASAIVLGAALALTTGVPMGVYLFGRMAGWTYCPYDDE